MGLCNSRIRKVQPQIVDTDNATKTTEKRDERRQLDDVAEKEPEVEYRSGNKTITEPEEECNLSAEMCLEYNVEEKTVTKAEKGACSGEKYQMDKLVMEGRLPDMRALKRARDRVVDEVVPPTPVPGAPVRRRTTYPQVKKDDFCIFSFLQPVPGSPEAKVASMDRTREDAKRIGVMRASRFQTYGRFREMQDLREIEMARSGDLNLSGNSLMNIYEEETTPSDELQYGLGLHNYVQGATLDIAPNFLRPN